MTPTPDTAVTLARMEMKIDTLLKTSSDHEARLRDLETATRSGRALAMTIANAVLTVLTVGTAALGTTALR
jgi:hypothetical protein